MNDTISRQQTIAALRALSDEDGYISAPHEVVTDVVRGLPPVQAEQGQTTRSERGKTDKLGVKTGETYKDTISRKAAIDIIEDFPHGGVWNVESMEEMVYRIKQLPSAQTEIIRCKECRWWDKYGDYDKGYCMAAKHGYWSEHWEINIRRTYKGDFYCADVEPKEGQDESI